MTISTTMTAEEIMNAARTAGARGVSWMSWTYDLSQEVMDAHDRGIVKLDAMKKAHADGLREHRLATWRIAWTTAPEAYDQFGTETVETCGEWHDKTLRKIVMLPEQAGYQMARFDSGLHGSWDEDPRIEEARWQEELRREKAEKEERAAKHAAGLAWLTSLTDEQLDEAIDGETGNDVDLKVGEYRLGGSDCVAERKKRRAAKAAAERAATWAKCRALVPDGVDLIDNGTPTIRGHHGPIKGRDPGAWRAIKVEPHWSYTDDAEQARVVGEGNVYIGSLALVADRIEKGEMRVAGSDDHIPPRAVVVRIGCDYADITRVDAGERAVWVGRPRFAREPLVVDEKGHLVRIKKIREAAERAYWNRYFAPTPATPST